jgi:lanthionine synthetase-like protein
LARVDGQRAEAYVEVADAAWAWVLDQVRWDDEGPWIPESAADSAPTRRYRNGMHSGIGSLALTLADIRLGRAWTHAERHLADVIAERLRAAIPTETDYTFIDGLVSTIGVLIALDEPGADLAVRRLNTLATPDGWPQEFLERPRFRPDARVNDVVLGTAGVLLGALWARRADDARHAGGVAGADVAAGKGDPNDAAAAAGSRGVAGGGGAGLGSAGRSAGREGAGGAAGGGGADRGSGGWAVGGPGVGGANDAAAAAGSSCEARAAGSSGVAGAGGAGLGSAGRVAGGEGAGGAGGVGLADELAGRAVAVLMAEMESMPTGANWRYVPQRFRTDDGPQLPNFSHGLAGVAAALALAGAELGRPDLTDAARRGAEHLVTLGEADGRGFAVPHRIPPADDRDEFAYGWCHGPTGTSLLFLALEHAGVGDIVGAPPPTWHRRCLHRVRKSGLPERRYPGFWDNDGRCCGTAGVGEGFLNSWQRTGNGDDLDFALHLADTLVERAVRDGEHAYWRFVEHRADEPLLPPGVGWMQGAAGIAAFLFRAARADRGDASVVPRMDTWWALDRPPA